jgi:hypothetical protein
MTNRKAAIQQTQADKQSPKLRKSEMGLPAANPSKSNQRPKPKKTTDEIMSPVERVVECFGILGLRPHNGTPIFAKHHVHGNIHIRL